MVNKSGSRKNSSNVYRSDAGNRDQFVEELKNRIAFLENELWLKPEEVISPNALECLEAELKYSRLLATISSGFCIADNEGRFLEANDACCRILGYTREELLTMSIADVEVVEMPASVLSHIQALRQKTYDRFISRHRRKDGSIIDVDVNASYLDIGGGSVAILFNDITQRRRSDEALQFERLQLLSIFDSIDEVIYVADPYTYEILYANKAMQGKFGKRLVGGTCYREIQNRDAPCEFCTNNTILKNKGKPHRWEFYNPTVDRSFDIVDRIIQWPDGRDVRFEVAIDITDRKRAEKALRESEGKYRELVENANSIIIRWDAQGNLTFFNEFAEKLFGYTKGEVLGRNVVGTIVPLAESTGRDLAALMEEVERHPERFEVNVNENVCKNGDRVWIAWTNKAIRDDHGKVVEILSVGNDITERRRAEEESNAAKQQAELYVDLMGHDINNMNQVSLGFLELAHNIVEMNGKLGKDDIVLLDKAMDSLKNSSQLIDNVRKLQREKMGLYEPEVLDIGGVIEDAVQLYHNIPGRNVKIACTTEKHCYVSANSLLKDVFINLIGNAVKHSRGDLTVKIGIDQVTDNGINYCRVEVEDNGPGIPDLLKNTLFGRLNLTMTRARGKGFGLCMIKMLVDDYHGKFWVEDRVKGDHTRGARFVVMLPAVEK